MKISMKYLIGAAAGIGMYTLYKKYSPEMMCDLKKSVKKMSKDASKSIENMM